MKTIEEINKAIIGIQPNEGKVSDGYHTFDELYDFRRAYNAALVNTHKYPCIKSCRHSDGELCFGGGWFVVQIQLPTGQISNHYENKYWDDFDCEERERADEWDGHTDKDVLERLTNLKFISKEEVHQREEEFDAQAKEWFRNICSKEDVIKAFNPNEHKISIPLPEDAKWEAIGRGYASVLMDKQTRIDRLERIVWVLYENICKDVKSNVIYDDDLETSLCSDIIEKVEQLKNK